MQFSVVASFSGIASDPECQYETNYDDIRRVCRDLEIPFTETEDGDSEYGYLPGENFDVEKFLTELCAKVAQTHDVELPDKDDRNFEWQLEFLRENADVDDLRGLSFWERFAVRCRDLDIGTMMDRKTFTKFMGDIGAYCTDEETMGTLGGPLSNGMPTIVADMVFRVESNCLIDSIRVTPIPGTIDSPLGTSCKSADDAERIWGRLKNAMLSVYGL